MSATSTLSEKIVLAVGTGEDPSEISGLASASALTSTELNYLSGAAAANSGTNKALITGTSGAVTIAGVASMVGVTRAPVVIPDATPYTVLAANSGKVHIIAEQTSNITINLPVVAAGLHYKFIMGGVATEAQNWIFVATTPSFWNGGVVWLDLNAGAASDEIGVVYGNGSSHLTFTAVTPAAGTVIEAYTDGTEWYLFGTVVSDSTPTMA